MFVLLIIAKRADEIIFNGQQEVDGIRIKKSDDSAAGAKSDKVNKLEAEEESPKKEVESKPDVSDSKEATEKAGQSDAETDETIEFDPTDKSADETNDDDERGKRTS